jgi:CheY-like chemotaxis protein
LGPRHSPHPGMDRRRFLLTALAAALVVPLAAGGTRRGGGCRESDCCSRVLIGASPIRHVVARGKVGGTDYRIRRAAQYARVVPSPVGRVLVVDDEPHIGSVLRELLTEWGHTVQLAQMGSTALALLHEFQPDVVLLDLGLSDMPGDLVLARLQEVNPLLPVVMITGNIDPELARRTLEQGAFDYIAKPFKLERLAEVLEAALAYRE